MENVSKALLIAAGILLALMIISMGISVFRYIQEVKNAENERIATEQLQEFNSEYECYNKKIMYGGDVVSVYNKIIDNNTKNPKIEFLVIDDGNKQLSIPSEENDEIGIDDIGKTNIFKCTSISYDKNTGRVNHIEFQRVSKDGNPL